MAKIKITLVKSSNGRLPAQKATLQALGLRKISSSVIKPKNVAVLGMVRAVNHLVKTEDVV